MSAINKIVTDTACNSNQLIIQVAGKALDDEHKKQRLYIKSGSSKHYAKEYEEVTPTNERIASRLYKWDWKTIKSALHIEIWLEIQTENKGKEINLLLGTINEASCLQIDKQQNQIVPIVPCSLIHDLTYYSNSNHAIPALCREGYFYIFKGEQPWRELKIEQNDGITTYRDIPLSNYYIEEDNQYWFKDKPRIATGKPLKEIWVPTSFDNITQLDLYLEGYSFFYSEVQLSAARLNLLRNGKPLISHSYPTTTVSENDFLNTNENEGIKNGLVAHKNLILKKHIGEIIENNELIEYVKNYKNSNGLNNSLSTTIEALKQSIFPSSFIPKHRPRDLLTECSFNHPIKYLFDENYIKSAIESAKKLYQYCQQDKLSELNNPDNIKLDHLIEDTEISFLQNELNKQTSSNNSNEEPATSEEMIPSPFINAMEDAHNRGLYCIIVEDPHYRTRLLSTIAKQAKSMLLDTLKKAEKRKYFDSAMLFNQTIYPNSDRKIQNKLQDLSPSNHQYISYNTCAIERATFARSFHYAAQHLLQLFKQPEYISIWADHLSLSDPQHYAAAYCNLISTLSIATTSLEELDPIITVTNSFMHTKGIYYGYNPNEKRPYILSIDNEQNGYLFIRQITQSPTLTLHKMIFPPIDRNALIKPLEGKLPKIENDGTGNIRPYLLNDCIDRLSIIKEEKQTTIDTAMLMLTNDYNINIHNIVVDTLKGLKSAIGFACIDLDNIIQKAFKSIKPETTDNNPTTGSTSNQKNHDQLFDEEYSNHKKSQEEFSFTPDKITSPKTETIYSYVDKNGKKIEQLVNKEHWVYADTGTTIFVPQMEQFYSVTKQTKQYTTTHTVKVDSDIALIKAQQNWMYQDLNKIIGEPSVEFSNHNEFMEQSFISKISLHQKEIPVWQTITFEHKRQVAGNILRNAYFSLFTRRTNKKENGIIIHMPLENINPENIKRIYGETTNEEGGITGSTNQKNLENTTYRKADSDRLVIFAPENSPLHNTVQKITQEYKSYNSTFKRGSSSYNSSSTNTDVANTTSSTDTNTTYSTSSTNISNKAKTTNNLDQIPIYRLSIIGFQSYNFINAIEAYREDPSIRNLTDTSVSIMDLLLAVEDYYSYTTKTNVISTVLRKPININITVPLLKNSQNHLTKITISRLVILETTLNLISLGIACYDLYNAYTNNENSMVLTGYSLTIGGCIAGIVATYYSGIALAHPLGWVALGLVIIGSILVNTNSSTELELWISNGPFSNNPKDHLKDPIEAFYRLIGTFVQINISITSPQLGYPNPNTIENGTSIKLTHNINSIIPKEVEEKIYFDVINYQFAGESLKRYYSIKEKKLLGNTKEYIADTPPSPLYWSIKAQFSVTYKENIKFYFPALKVGDKKHTYLDARNSKVDWYDRNQIFWETK